MFKTFLAEMKNIFNNKWKIFTLIFIIFIPFLYGFLYMNAFWSPFSKTQNLKIGIVNKDDSKSSDKFEKYIIDNPIHVSKSIYKFQKIKNKNINSQKEVDSGEYAAILEIPSKFEEGNNAIIELIDTNINLKNKNNENIGNLKYLLAGKISWEKLKTFNSFDINYSKINTNNIINIFKEKANGSIKFYNSFKNNYLEGEMTNFLSDSSKWTSIFIAKNINNYWKQKIDSSEIPSNFKNKLENYIENISNEFIKINILRKIINIEYTSSGNINTYGFGLSPYFISIALWAGTLVMCLFIKNNRYIKTESTLKHYFGKWLVWISIGIIQSLILTTAITIQGVNLGWKHQWELYLYTIFMSIIFATIVQGIIFCFRYGDLGEFVIVLLLIIQLISCSGTFPVEMQNIIFKIISPIVPFTYTIETIREIFWDPNILLIIKNIFILLIFPTIILPVSLFINWKFDKKNIKKHKEYSSFEIDLEEF